MYLVFFYFPYLALTLVLPLDGVAMNFYYYFYLLGYARIAQLILSGFIYSYLLCPRRKTIWSELESNLGPLVAFCSQVTALTTWPCLLGQGDVPSCESTILRIRRFEKSEKLDSTILKWAESTIRIKQVVECKLHPSIHLGIYNF